MKRARARVRVREWERVRVSETDGRTDGRTDRQTDRDGDGDRDGDKCRERCNIFGFIAFSYLTPDTHLTKTAQDECLESFQHTLIIDVSCGCRNAFLMKWYSFGLWMMSNKANLRDLIAATGLVILLKLDLNRRFFSPCDLEIWWMTPKNHRAPLLCYFNRCASFRSHWWIMTIWNINAWQR